MAVDEFQDVNPAQFRLIEALLGTRVDLCAVGDPNQAIYGWNGADPGLLASLPERVPGLEVIHLEHNHRCTPQVVAAAVAGPGARGRGPHRDRPHPTARRPPSPPSPTTGRRPRPWRPGSSSGPRRACAGPTRPCWPGRTTSSPESGGRWSDAGIPCRIAPAPESADTEAPAPASGRAAGPDCLVGPERPGGGVELATFHRAKGLEWEAVSVVGLEEGFVPIVHAGDPGAVAEERRLLYVALTRAARVLDCSWARTRTPGRWAADGAPPLPVAGGTVRGRRRGHRPSRPPGGRRAIRRLAGEPQGLTRGVPRTSAGSTYR